MIDRFENFVAFMCAITFSFGKTGKTFIFPCIKSIKIRNSVNGSKFCQMTSVVMCNQTIKIEKYSTEHAQTFNT